MVKTTSKTKSSVMDKILSSKEAPNLPKEGDLIEGEVVFVGRNEILVDLGGILTGIIRGHEAYDESGEYNNLKVGDKIGATVVEVENEKGLMELSIKQAGHKKAWDKLRQIKAEGEIVEIQVVDANKGGLMIKLDQVVGFLPVSQLSPEHYPRVVGGNKSKILEKLKALTGSKLEVQIIDINDEEGALIVSERSISSEKRSKILKEYKKGDVIEGAITGVVDFGAFMEFGDGLEGLIHISEMGWQRIDNPRDIVREGQKIKAQIIDINAHKVSLSLKRLEKDPWEAIKDKYKVGDKVKAKVIKRHKLGVFVELEPHIQGLARLVNFNNGDKTEEDKKKKMELEVGKEYDFVITNFEPVDHKLGLDIA